MSSEGRSRNTPIDRALNLINNAERDDNYAVLDNDANRDLFDRDRLWEALTKMKTTVGIFIAKSITAQLIIFLL